MNILHVCNSKYKSPLTRRLKSLSSYIRVTEVLSTELSQFLDVPKFKLHKKNFDRILITCNVQSRASVIRRCAKLRLPMLTELPISKKLTTVQEIYSLVKDNNLKLNTICNCRFLTEPILEKNRHQIYYQDQNINDIAFPWNSTIMQLLYMSHEWNSYFDNSRSTNILIDLVDVPTSSIIASQTKMFKLWLENSKELWSINDILGIHKKALRFEEIWKAKLIKDSKLKDDPADIEEEYDD